MNIKQWIWGLHCERCFAVLLNRKPRWQDDEEKRESAFDFALDLEMQLGVESGGSVYAQCPYEDCDGDLKDFWWWEEYERQHPNAPEVPEPGRAYPT